MLEMSDLRQAIVDDLSHCDVATIRHDVERLGLDCRRAWRHPLQVFALQLRPWRRFCLSRDGLYGGTAINGFLYANAVED